MNETTKFELKRRWDSAPKLGAAPGSSGFAGRQQELDRLAYSLQSRAHGNILISGQRGVGKTSLVFEAINTIQARLNAAKDSAQAKSNDFTVVPVYINSAHIERKQTRVPAVPSSEADEARLILRNLIQRLYVALAVDSNSRLSEEVRKIVDSELSVLYKKATSNFRTEESAAFSGINSKDRATESTLEKAAWFDASVFKSGVLWVGMALVAFFQYEVHAQEVNTWLSVSMPLLLAIPIAFSIREYYLRRIRTWTQTVSKISAQSCYAQDNSVANLEFDLEQLQQRLSKNGIEIVYIIDELDKIDTPQAVLDLLKFLKPFLTQSSATFILLAGAELQTQLQAARADRGIAYTYFTETYYLQRPAASDLILFLKNVLQVPAGASSAEFENFAYYLIFLARGDFFDLHRVIRDHISEFDGAGGAFMEIRPLKNHELPLAYFQRIHSMVATYLRRPSPADWYTNEQMVAELYKRIDAILANPGQNLDDPAGIGLVEEGVRLFNRLLYRCHAAKQPEQLTTLSIRGETVGVYRYRWVGLTEAPPTTINFETEAESIYRKKFERYQSLVKELYYAEQALSADATGGLAIGDMQTFFQKRGGQFESTYKTHSANIKVLDQRIPATLFSREDLINFSKQVDQAISALRTNAIQSVVAALQKKYPQLTTSHVQNDPRLFPEVPNFRNRGVSTSHVVLRPTNNSSAPNFEKQLYIGLDLPNEALSDNDKKQLAPHVGKRRILNLTTTGNPGPVVDGTLSNCDISEGFTALSTAFKEIDQWWSSSQ